MSFPSLSTYSHTPGYGESISGIFGIFTRHMLSLADQQRKANQAIDDWSSGLINRIRDHAQKQRQLVDEAYNIHEKHLRNMREQFIEINGIYQRKNDTEEINRLLQRCKTLKVDIVNITFRSSNNEFIEVTVVEPSDGMEPEDPNPRKTRDEKFENARPKRDETESAYDKDFNSSLYSYSTASASNRTDQSSTTRAMHASDWSENPNDSNTPKTDFKKDDNSIDKCPMCFMIFPTNMSETGRTMHVEEHYKDE